MSAQLYTVATRVYAALWNGDTEDLKGFPENVFTDLEFIVEPGTFILRFWNQHSYQEIKPGEGYLVRGMTGIYFAVPAEAFGSIYRPVVG